MLGRLLAAWRSRGRRIYQFHDGARRRRLDPIVVHRTLEAAGGPDWDKHLDSLVADKPPPFLTGNLLATFQAQQTAAVAAIVAAGRAAFGVKPLDDDGRGLTEAETVALVADFLVFLGGLAEAALPFVNSPPSASPSTPAGSPTASSSASGTPESGSPASSPIA